MTLVCPKYLILPYLRETAEELRTREPEHKPWFRCKVMLSGSENDDPGFTQLIEGCGAMVVADRYCYGSMPGQGGDSRRRRPGARWTPSRGTT